MRNIQKSSRQERDILSSLSALENAGKKAAREQNLPVLHPVSAEQALKVLQKPKVHAEHVKKALHILRKRDEN